MESQSYKPGKESPDIVILNEKQLVGQQLEMSLTENRTGELWREFIPRIKEINGRIGSDRISMQVHDAGYFEAFDPKRNFTKWAAVEVKNNDLVPSGMESFTLPTGLYAVFHYKGSSADTRIFQYIFATWLPASDYELDNRPHFEVLGEKYRNNDPNSEEEIWIPVKKKLKTS